MQYFSVSIFSNSPTVDEDCSFTSELFLPPQMLAGYGDFLYQTGMVDELQKRYVDEQTDFAVQLIQKQKWVEAFKVSQMQKEALETWFNQLQTSTPPIVSGF